MHRSRVHCAVQSQDQVPTRCFMNSNGSLEYSVPGLGYADTRAKVINLTGSAFQPPRVNNSRSSVPPQPPPRYISASSASSSAVPSNRVVDASIFACSSDPRASLDARTGVATRIQHPATTTNGTGNRSGLSDYLLRLLMRGSAIPSPTALEKCKQKGAEQNGPDLGSLKRFFGSQTKRISPPNASPSMGAACEEVQRLMSHLVRIIYEDDHHAQSIEGVPVALNVQETDSTETPSVSKRSTRGLFMYAEPAKPSTSTTTHTSSLIPGAFNPLIRNMRLLHGRARAECQMLHESPSSCLLAEPLDRQPICQLRSG
ncbi:hypothetical protein Ciccas_012218 [Cichlidogyrus casuarinus]|uniref:Uncharacterized protein n=1 Tax=Cichlidogyrus casuarinus TaxID=1844966 RepID=A0ABD2PS33_9PLAT